MNLRLKTLLITSAVLLAAFLAIFAYSRFFLLTSYDRLESDLMAKNAVRAAAVLNNYLDQLSRTAHDYASWNDSYAFIIDHNQKYVTVNLMDTTFANTKISLMVYQDLSGRVIFAKNYDLDTGQTTPLPPALLAIGSPIASYYQTPTEKHQGLLVLPQGTLLLSSQPIMTSDDTGPARGTLIFGRFLDQGMKELLNRSIDLPVETYPLNDPRLPADGRSAGQRMIATRKTALANVLDGKRIAGYTLFNDLSGRPALIIKLTSQRQIYNKGYQTIIVYQIFLFAIGLVTMGLLAWLLETYILTRLARINHDIGRIGTSGDLATRLPVEGKDELTTVSTEINRMLDSLQSSRNAERAGEQRFQTVFDASPDAILLQTLDGRIIDCNAAAVTVTGFNRQELLKMTTADLVPVEVVAGLPALMEQAATLGSFKIESTNKRQSGEHFPVEVTGKTIEFKGDKLLLVVFRDITDRKRTEAELKGKLDQLEEFHSLTVGRELKMMELEKDINALLQELGRAPRYQ